MSQEIAPIRSSMEPPLVLCQSIWSIIDHLPVSFYVKDSHSRFIYLNQAAATSLGESQPRHAIGKMDCDYFETSVAASWLAQERDLIKTGSPLLDQVEQETLIGATKPGPWVLTSKLALRDQNGKVIGILGVSTNVKIARRNMEHVSLAVDCANDGLWYRNYISGHTWYSKRWKSMLGYEDSDLANDQTIFRGLVFPEDWTSVERAYARHKSGETPFYECHFRMQHRDRSWRWIHARGKARFGKNGEAEEFAGSHSDITDFKYKTDLYEQILEMLPVLVFLKDKECRFRYVNKETEEYFNLSRDILLGKTDSEVNANREQAERFLRDDQSILSGQKRELFIPEEPLTYQKTHEVRQLQTRKRFLSFPSNAPQPHVLGVATNITETIAAKAHAQQLRDTLALKLKTLTSMVTEIEKSESETAACETCIFHLKSVENVFGSPDIMISLRKVEDGRLCVVADERFATGIWKEMASETRRWCDVPDLDILPLVLQKGKAQFIPDTRLHPNCDRDLAKTHGLVSQYVIPLSTPSLEIGTLQVSMGARSERPAECDFYDAIGAHLSVAIERHRRLAELAEKNAQLLRTVQFVAWSSAGTVVIHGLKHSLNNFQLILNRTEHNPAVRSVTPAMDFLKDTQRFVSHWMDLFETHLHSARASSDTSTTDIDIAVADVVELVQPKARSRSTKIAWKDSVRKDLRVWIPKLYIHEMLSVLITNAIDAHARVVRVEAEKVETTLPNGNRAHSYVRLRIHDDGHGIAAEYQDQVGKFGWTSKRAIGHGVGLTIVTTLAEAFSGGLSLLSGGRSVGQPETIFELLIPSAD